MVLQAVVSQQLIPTLDGHLVPAFEIMVATPAIRTMIRESKIYQIDNVLYAGGAQGMQAMDADLLRLAASGVISRKMPWPTAQVRTRWPKSCRFDSFGHGPSINPPIILHVTVL